jgi:ABC-type glycerol-3-phosphate transport system substrate-binding protein
LATGTGPDLIILPLDKFWQNRNKLAPIPYSSISQRTFQNTFIEEGELYFSPDGVYGLPVTVDPLVLYYNRDLLSKAGIASPISFWDEIYTASLKLTEKDGAGNIKKSTIALGEATNIPNYKGILSLLMLQAGTPITQMINQELNASIAGSFNQAVAPADAALDFYTQFSNPSKTYYSWNRSMLPANTNFASGDSAYYIGYASELRTLRSKNPTLNIGVAKVPQSRSSGNVLTFAQMRAISISRGTSNPVPALNAALKFVANDFETTISQRLLLPSPRRDILSLGTQDAVLSVFYDSALISKGWIDPESVSSSQIFREMIESVTSGRARTYEATSAANNELNALIK